jgi:hypothetical protein
MGLKSILPVALFLLALCAVSSAVAGGLPACNPGLLSRRGNQIDMSLSKLAQHFNERLSTAHSKLADIQLTAENANQLRISGERNGQPVSVSGPLAPAAGSGGLQLHAAQIERNGKPVKGMMGLFGKDLANYVNVQNTPTVYAKGNNLEINVDRLLGVAGHVIGVRLRGSRIEMQFASQPCQ